MAGRRTEKPPPGTRRAKVGEVLGNTDPGRQDGAFTAILELAVPKNRQRLADVLRELCENGCSDFVAILTALGPAALHGREATSERYLLQTRRQTFARRRRKLTKLEAALQNAKGMLPSPGLSILLQDVQHGRDDGLGPAILTAPAIPALLEWVRAHLRALDAAQRGALAIRRRRAGQPAQPWLALARRALAAAGVEEEANQDELLILVGAQSRYRRTSR
jgi:hypothetical protein